MLTDSNITFTGHHVEITPAIKEYAVAKLNRLKNRGENITHIAVTFDVEKLNQIAKATLHIKGAEIHASHESDNLYASIDGLFDKLKRQIEKHHEER